MQKIGPPAPLSEGTQEADMVPATEPASASRPSYPVPGRSKHRAHVPLSTRSRLQSSRSRFDSSGGGLLCRNLAYVSHMVDRRR